MVCQTNKFLIFLVFGSILVKRAVEEGQKATNEGKEADAPAFPEGLQECFGKFA
jgi:hypothetical protein